MNLNSKKIIFITYFFIILSFVLFCINLLKESFSNETKNEIKKDEEIKEESYDIDYKSGTIINVQISSTGEVVAMDMNDYLRGVLPSEMPPYYEIEALKAQAIIARTYLYRKINDGGHESGVDICDNYSHCQAFYNKEKILEIWEKKGYDESTRKEYWKKINEAVVSTSNQVVKYNDEYIKAFFHASSPKRTEDVSQIWGGISYPYLVSVENMEEEDYQNRTSSVEVSLEELISKVENIDKSRYNLDDINSLDIHISDYTTSGRVKYIEVCGTKIKAENLRTDFGLKSTDFTIEIKENSIVFNVTGYGHGVGMSQVGANYYAKQGRSAEEIIKYYYNGVDIIDDK